MPTLSLLVAPEVVITTTSDATSDDKVGIMTNLRIHSMVLLVTQIAKFMGPTWGPPGSCRPQMGPMLAPWTLLSGGRLNKKDGLTRYGDSHVKDKTS